MYVIGLDGVIASVVFLLLFGASRKVGIYL